MKIQEQCHEPTSTEAFDNLIQYPSKAYYPPGLICAKDVTSRFCPTAGDSGSPLMVREANPRAESERFYLQGVLSYLKGCEKFAFQNRSTTRSATIIENPDCKKCNCYTPPTTESTTETTIEPPTHPNCSEACYSCYTFPEITINTQTEDDKEFTFISFTESPLAR